jgi:tetratricopeptide (TPR) repeat protein
MSDRDNSNSSLGKFLKNFSAPILAVISLISGVYGFVKLFADKDAGLITLISLGVGISLLLGICLYYARFWKPEQQDKRRSAFEPTPSDEQVRALAKKERRRKRVRRLAIVGLIAIPILSGSGVAGWKYIQSLPPKDIIVLVADFDSPDSKNFGVTETVINQLRQATGKYSDVKIQALNKSITEQEGSKVAWTEGEKRKATIAIWGWYRNTGAVVPLSVHFEILRPPKELPELGQTAKGQLQQAAIAELKSFTLQTRLSNEMSYLSLFTLGMTRYAAYDWDGAISRFSDAFSALEQPAKRVSALDQSIIHFYRGTAYSRRGDHDRAIADHNQAIKLQHNYVKSYNNRGNAYYQKEDYDRAFADYNQAIKLQSDYADAYHNRGSVYFKKGDYDRAFADYNQAIKLQHNHADAYRNRGNAYFEKGDYDRAFADYTQAIQIKPDDALTYITRGIAYYQKEDYDRAFADYNQAIKLQHNHADAYRSRVIAANAYTLRGIAYTKKGEHDRAITDFDQVIKLQPDDAEAYALRGRAYREKDDLDRAIADYNQAIKLKHDFAEVYALRGSAYIEKADLDHAITDFDQAIKLQPDNAEVYALRGSAYIEKADLGRAITDFDQAIKLQPDNAEVYALRGRAYSEKDDLDRAIANYNQVIQIKPDYSLAYMMRGFTYYKKGRKDKAIADFKKTLELTKEPKIRQDVEEVLKELGVK